MKTLPKTYHAAIARLIDGNRYRAAIIRVIINHNGYISITDIAKQLQLARSTVIRHIKILKHLRLIQHEGTPKGGRWRVVNCNRWDINLYMGIPLKLSFHLNRFASAEDLEWEEAIDRGTIPHVRGTKNDVCGTINHDCGTINHDCGTINHDCGTTYHGHPTTPSYHTSLKNK